MVALKAAKSPQRRLTKNMEIHNIPNLLEAVEDATKNFGGRLRTFWRGQPSAHPLLPGVFRTEERIDNEGNFVHRFKVMAPSRRSRCPSSDDLPSWLFLMQHYRLPTRLLDWTFSPLVALYFAVSKEPGQKGEIVALSPQGLNDDQINKAFMVTPSEESVQSVVKAAFVTDVFDREKGRTTLPIVALHPDEVDARMMVQMSTFTVHGSTTPIDELPNNEAFFARYEIPASAKADIKQELTNLGVREENLFPDLLHRKCANLSWKLKRLQTLWFDGIGRNNIKPVRERSRDEESVTFGEKTQEEASTG